MRRRLEPREGRQLYGQDPAAYALGRPDYPERVYELLASRCGLAPRAHVIEVGPGTGLVTRRLLGAGAHVTGIEPNAAMSAYLNLDPPTGFGGGARGACWRRGWAV